VSDAALDLDELLLSWPVLTPDERTASFRALDRTHADDFFLQLAPSDQAQLFREMPPGERRIWARVLAPDDLADVVQEVPEGLAAELISLLDEPSRLEVLALLAYAEDAAGGLMSPRFARLRPDMTVDEAFFYLRKQAQGQERLETIHYAYVVDHDQKLLGVVSFRDLFVATDRQLVRDVMTTEVVSVPETLDQEEVARLLTAHALIAIPVLDAEGRMKGIVTVDDIVDVVEQEATEDIQKMGGQEALGARYMETPLSLLIRKRAPWLAVLFLGELLTASAMSAYEDEIASALVLALFVPLIISSGGNSGSQATTLIIRAMALGEVGLRDWWRIARREVVTGLALGALLGALGFARVMIGEALGGDYQGHALAVAGTVALSLLGVVLWGTVAGSMLPFVIRAMKLDPATASAPFVATLVDVSGLVIYFNVAQLLLRGSLL
jgi:magnesium transporter